MDSWLVCFLAASCMLLCPAGLILLQRARRVPHRLKPLYLIYGGIFLSAFCLLLPVYGRLTAGEAPHGLKTIAFALHHTLQIFTLDADREIILSGIACRQSWLRTAYACILTTELIAGPLLTFSVIVSFFQNAAAFLRYLLYYFRDVYVLSDITEKSAALAGSLRKNHPDALIVFTDAAGEGSDEYQALRDQTAALGRVLFFSRDVASVGLEYHHRRAMLCFFIIDEDEDENTSQALRILERYGSWEKGRLFVFSTSVESEMVLNCHDGVRMRVQRVNDIRSLIYHNLYHEGGKLFDAALPAQDAALPAERQISAVIVGLGKHGTEMLKALAWYGQMDGYRLRVDAYEKDPLAGDRFTALCPELMSDAFNGQEIPGEARYTIRIHSGVDVNTATFARDIQSRPQTTYVLVALGADEANIRTAATLRMLYEQAGAHPVIQAIVYNSQKKEALNGAANFRGQDYGIAFIGDVDTSYSEAVILNSELEQQALEIHMRWGEERDFYRYEYNYRSSMAMAVHKAARRHCHIPGSDKETENLSEAERAALESLEHRRWNAYMRSEGYVFSGSTDKKTRNDLGKMHHDLIPYARLSEEEKRKDSKLGAK